MLKIKRYNANSEALTEPGSSCVRYDDLILQAAILENIKSPIYIGVT